MDTIMQSAFQINWTSDNAWGLQARQLKRAADVLFKVYCEDEVRVRKGEVTALDVADSLDMLIPASLLYGLALENLFKALIIREKKLSISEIQGLFGGGSGHNLTHLAQVAVFELSDEEADLVKRLAAFVEWAGRYPVHKKIQKMTMKQRAVEGEFLPLPLQQHENQLYESMFERADAIIFKRDVA